MKMVKIDIPTFGGRHELWDSLNSLVREVHHEGWLCWVMGFTQCFPGGSGSSKITPDSYDRYLGRLWCWGFFMIGYKSSWMLWCWPPMFEWCVDFSGSVEMLICETTNPEKRSFRAKSAHFSLLGVAKVCSSCWEGGSWGFRLVRTLSSRSW